MGSAAQDHVLGGSASTLNRLSDQPPCFQCLPPSLDLNQMDISPNTTIYLVSFESYSRLAQSYLQPSFKVLSTAPPPYGHLIICWALGS